MAAAFAPAKAGIAAGGYGFIRPVGASFAVGASLARDRNHNVGSKAASHNRNLPNCGSEPFCAGMHLDREGQDARERSSDSNAECRQLRYLLHVTRLAEQYAPARPAAGWPPVPPGGSRA